MDVVPLLLATSTDIAGWGDKSKSRAVMNMVPLLLAIETDVAWWDRSKIAPPTRRGRDGAVPDEVPLLLAKSTDVAWWRGGRGERKRAVFDVVPPLLAKSTDVAWRWDRTLAARVGLPTSSALVTVFNVVPRNVATAANVSIWHAFSSFSASDGLNGLVHPVLVRRAGLSFRRVVKEKIVIFYSRPR